MPTSRTLIAGAGLTGGGDLGANRTFDIGATDGSISVAANGISVGVLQSDGQHGDRGGGALHAVATGTDAGFMSAAHWNELEDATVEPTSNTLARHGAEGELKTNWLQIGDQGAWPTQGDVRGDEDFSIYAIKSDTSDVRVLEVSTSTLILGDENNAMTPQFRSALNTGVAFRHGPSLVTYFRPIPTGPCSAPGDLRFDLATGQIYSYLQGAGEVALSSNATIPYHKDRADTNPLDELPEFPLSLSLGRLWTLASVKIAFSDVVIADDANYAQFFVMLRSSSGSSAGTIAIGSTTTSGSNAMGDCEPYQEVTITPQPGALTLPINPSHRIAFAYTKHGDGVLLPPFNLTLTTKTFGS